MLGWCRWKRVGERLDIRVTKDEIGMVDQLIRLLQKITPIPAREREKAAAIFRPLEVPKGGFFMRAGEVPNNLGFVISGLLRLFYIDREGNDFTKSFCAESGFVAAYSALLLKEPSRLFIEALEDSTILVAEYEAFQRLTAGHPCWQAVNRYMAETLFIKKERRESELLLDDATTRYLNFQKEFPGLEPRIKKYHIASYLGITPVTLSRIRTQLKQKN